MQYFKVIHQGIVLQLKDCKHGSQMHLSHNITGLNRRSLWPACEIL
jgi:hypothetical protein